MKQIAVLLALLLCLSACGAKQQAAPQTQSDPAADAQTVPEEQAPTGEESAPEEGSAAGETPTAEETPAVEETPAATAAEVTVEQNRESTTAEDGTEVLYTEYPVFTVTVPGSSAAADQIAADLAKTVEEYRQQLAHGMSGESESLAADALEDYQYHKDEGVDWTPYADQLSAEILRCDQQVLCVNFGSYIYTGGVHGFHYTFGRCYDVATGERLTLENLAEEGVDLKQAMLDKVTEMSHDPELYDPDLFFEGYEEYLPDVVGDEFTMNEAGITFSAAPYTLGSYAAGQIDFTIPYDQLAGLVQSRYLPE